MQPGDLKSCPRAKFEVRPDEASPWIWEVWDVTASPVCNHFPVARIDSKGASEDHHEEMANVCAVALMDHYAAPALPSASIPREPTEAMVRAGGMAINDDADVLAVTGQEARQAWQAMYDAAPALPSVPDVEALVERLLGELCNSAQNDRRPIDMPSALSGIELGLSTQAAELTRLRAMCDELAGAVEPFTKIPLCYPRRGSQPQQAELDVPAPGGAYTVADVVRARKMIP